MKLLCIGDPHAKISNIKDIRLLAEKIVAIVKDTKPDAVVIMGDLHDTSDHAYLQAWNSVISFLDVISSEITTYYIVGNHCAINNQIFLTDEHFFNAFKKWPNLIVVDWPTWVGNCLMVPYVPPGRFIEALNSAGKWPSASVILAHQEFYGAQMGAITSLTGDYWSESNPLVVSGHIHDSQWIGRNVYYVGTPYQTSFGDKGEKTIALVDTDSCNITTLPIIGMPKKISIKTNTSEFLELSIDNGHHYRITIHDTSENISRLKTTEFYKKAALAAKIIFIPIDAAQMSKKVAKTDNYASLLKKSIEKETKLVQDLAEEVLK